MGNSADRRDELVIAALISNPTVRAASAACGICETQIHARLRRPAFRKKYDAARRALLEQTTAYMQGVLSEAVNKMLDIMRDEDASPQTQLNAAEAVVRTCLKLTEQADIIAQLEEVKNAIWKE